MLHGCIAAWCIHAGHRLEPHNSCFNCLRRVWPDGNTLATTCLRHACLGLRIWRQRRSKSHITRRYGADVLSRASVCPWRCAHWAHALASLTDVFCLYVATASAYAVEVYVYKLNGTDKHRALPNPTTVFRSISNLSSSPSRLASPGAPATSRFGPVPQVISQRPQVFTDLLLRWEHNPCDIFAQIQRFLKSISHSAAWSSQRKIQSSLRRSQQSSCEAASPSCPPSTSISRDSDLDGFSGERGCFEEPDPLSSPADKIRYHPWKMRLAFFLSFVDAWRWDPELVVLHMCLLLMQVLQLCLMSVLFDALTPLANCVLII
jgi:hypothetical protein